MLQAHQAPLIFWDLGGQAGLRSIWDKYYAESHAILYVVDSGRACVWFPDACDAAGDFNCALCQPHQQLFHAAQLTSAATVSIKMMLLMQLMKGG